MLFLLGASLCPEGSGVAPSKAQAFIGESEVINGAKLSAEAEAFLKEKVSIPEIFEGGPTEPPAPPPEAQAWTDFLDGGGALPIMTSVLAFGVGTVIGSEVCHSILELEGCWYYGSEGADEPTGEPSYSWLWGTTEGSYPYEWHWSRGTVNYHGHFDSIPCSGGSTWPGGTSTSIPGKVANTTCYEEGTPELVREPVTWTEVQPIRYAMSNRVIEAHAKDNPEIENYTGKAYCPAVAPTACTESPSSNWSERAVGILNKPSSSGLTNGQRDEIGEHIAANTPKGEELGIHDPLKTYVTVPTCSGEAWIECKADLEELELVPERSELTWEKAVIEDGPDRVEELSPAPGSEVTTGSKLVVVTNPDTEGMPAVIPEISKGETYDEYVAKFSPALDPTRDAVSDAAADTSLGPDAALRTDPVEGTRENPAVSTDVDVQTNPKDIPPVAGGVTCSTSSPEVDFSPLNKNLGSKFPFGIVAFFVGWVEEWETEFPTPEFSVHIPHAGTIHIDMGSVSSLLPPIRIAIVFAAFVGMLWFLGTAALKIQGDSSE